MQKSLNDYFDERGIVCNSPPTFDGGDSLANEATMAYCDGQSGLIGGMYMLRTFTDSATGICVRHPDKNKWYSNPNTTSRDQITPLLCVLATVAGHKRDFYKMAKLHAKRGFLFAWNSRRNFQYPTLAEHLQRSTPDVVWDYKWKVPDFCGPDIWSIYCRGVIVHIGAPMPKIVTACVLMPIILLGDLQLLGGAILAQYKWMFKQAKGTGRDGIDHDDRNQALKLHHAVNYVPTPISLLAKTIYGTDRPLACFKSFWGDRLEEPPINQFMNQLYKRK